MTPMIELGKDCPLVYIVMRNHNKFCLTHESLISLNKLTYPNYRILVVDDGSIDDSPDKIVKNFPGIKLIRTGKYLEYCKSLNFGIRYALKDGAQYVFLVNNDTKDFSPNYFEEIIQAFRDNNKVGMIGSLCYDYDGNFRREGIAKDKLGVPMEIPTEGFVIKREVIETIGLLNEMLVRYFEDLDYIIRLRNAGYQTHVVSTVSFAHLGGGTSSKQIFIPNYYRVRNLILFIRKHCTDKSLGWKMRECYKYLSLHTGRMKTSLRKGEFGSFFKISGSVALGLMAGFLFKWREEYGL